MCALKMPHPHCLFLRLQLIHMILFCTIPPLISGFFPSASSPAIPCFVYLPNYENFQLTGLQKKKIQRCGHRKSELELLTSSERISQLLFLAIKCAVANDFFDSEELEGSNERYTQNCNEF
uniref:Uncharacterized protein n=1 Tax=Parascaris univalens TaxID=6257 RepID=A0A915ANW3_PARUN